MPTFFVGNPETPLEEKAPVVPIAKTARVAPSPAAPPVETGGFSTRFGDESASSRLRHSLPTGELKHRWEALVRLRTGARGVLLANDRVVAVGVDDRESYDAHDGSSLGFKAPVLGEVLLDGGHGLLWCGEPTGAIAARRLSDGGPEFLLMSAFGKGYTRELFARRGERVLVVSRQAPDRGFPKPPDMSIFEVFDLGSAPKAPNGGFLEGAKKKACLFSRTRPIHAAASGEKLVVAVQNRIYVFALADLALERVITGEFAPQALSLDEGARIHLIVTAPDEDPPAGDRKPLPKTYLWALEPTGERAFSFEVPAGQQRPPIVGYDHAVHVLSGRTIFAVSAEGTPLWQQSFARLGGAAATPCGRLLVSAGTELVALNAKGEASPVASLPGEVQGPAVLTAEGDVVAATMNHVYRIGKA